MKAVFEAAVFLNWHSAMMARPNFRPILIYNITFLPEGLTHDMLTIHGQYINPITRGQIGQQAYFQ